MELLPSCHGLSPLVKPAPSVSLSASNSLGLSGTSNLTSRPLRIGSRPQTARHKSRRPPFPELSKERRVQSTRNGLPLEVSIVGLKWRSGYVPKGRFKRFVWRQDALIEEVEPSYHYLDVVLCLVDSGRTFLTIHYTCMRKMDSHLVVLHILIKQIEFVGRHS